MTLNFAFYLSLVLAAFGCTGLILAGKGKWYGWGVGLAVQPVWATYAIVTKGYGLLITCAMYGFVNARNLWKWHTNKPVLGSAPVSNSSPPGGFEYPRTPTQEEFQAMAYEQYASYYLNGNWVDEDVPLDDTEHFEKFWAQKNEVIGRIISVKQDDKGLDVTYELNEPGFTKE